MTYTNMFSVLDSQTHGHTIPFITRVFPPLVKKIALLVKAILPRTQARFYLNDCPHRSTVEMQSSAEVILILRQSMHRAAIDITRKLINSEPWL